MTKQKQIQTWTYVLTLPTYTYYSMYIYTARIYMFACIAHICGILDTCVLWSVDLFTSWTCTFCNYIITNITYTYLEYMKCNKGKGSGHDFIFFYNYLINSFVWFEDFENIFNNMSSLGGGNRVIDLGKSEDIFLNVNSICDEIIVEHLCRRRRFFQDSTNECGFLDPQLNMYSGLKMQQNTPKNFTYLTYI